MYSDKDTPCGVGCPIRRPRDHRSLASPPGFSQRATSFIASQCQGIHQMPLLALDPRRFRKETPHKKPPRTGAKPCFPRQRDAAPAKSGAHAVWRPHMKTLLGHVQRVCAGRIRLGHMTNSLFTLQTTPPPRSPRTVSYSLLQTPVVEV